MSFSWSKMWRNYKFAWNSCIVICFQVRVLNKYYAGPPSSPLIFTTPEGEPGPPAAFDVLARGPTHFDLVWEFPQEPNGNLMGYNISYQSITGMWFCWISFIISGSLHLLETKLFLYCLDASDLKPSQLIWPAARACHYDKMIRLGVRHIPYSFRGVQGLLLASA